MKLTSVKAKEILDSYRGKSFSDDWIEHSLCVGNSASIIAKSLNLDDEKAKTLGYIHDIGRAIDSSNHVLAGYYYLKELGYDDEYCNICLTHSYLNNDCDCTAGGFPKYDEFKNKFIKEHEFTIYEKIINLCDLMCTNVVNTVDKRLIDLIIRKGAHSNTQYHVSETYKLKKYFDNLLGYNLYDLFPSIKDNL